MTQDDKDQEVIQLQKSYKKLIDNENARYEEEQAEREKWMRQEKTDRKKYYHLELHETPETIIKVMNLFIEVNK